MLKEKPILEGTGLSRTLITKIKDDKREVVRLDTDVCNALLQTFLDSPEAVEEFLKEFSMQMEILNTNPMFRRRVAQEVAENIQ